MDTSIGALWVSGEVGPFPLENMASILANLIAISWCSSDIFYSLREECSTREKSCPCDRLFLQAPCQGVFSCASRVLLYKGIDFDGHECGLDWYLIHNLGENVFI